MLVKNLVAWSAGPNGKPVLPGDHIDLPEKIARARIAAGVAGPPDRGAEIGDNIGALKKALGDAHGKLAAMSDRLDESQDSHDETQDKFAAAAETWARERAALADQLEKLGAAHDALVAEHETVLAARDAAEKERDALKEAAAKVAESNGGKDKDKK